MTAWNRQKVIDLFVENPYNVNVKRCKYKDNEFVLKDNGFTHWFYINDNDVIHTAESESGFGVNYTESLTHSEAVGFLY